MNGWLEQRCGRGCQASFVLRQRYPASTRISASSYSAQSKAMRQRQLAGRVWNRCSIRHGSRRFPKPSAERGQGRGRAGMAAYLIANIDVLDPDGYDQYRSRSRPIVQRHGGRFIVRGGEVEILEGAEQIRRVVVIEFPNRAAARA